VRLFEPDDIPEPFEEPALPDPVSESQARSSLHGKEYDALALEFLEQAGGTIVEVYPRVSGYRLDAVVEGANGARYYVDAHGSPDRTDRPQAGLRRQDTVLKLGFKAMRIHYRRSPYPLIVLTSHMPKAGTSSAYLLSELADSVLDVVGTVGDLAGYRRLHAYLTDIPPPAAPLPAPWRAAPLSFDDIDLFDDRRGAGEDDDA
jgi:hypothetical protein